MANFSFTNGRFEECSRENWDFIMPRLNPKRILEIGSYEGFNSVPGKKFAKYQSIEIHCLDTWAGGIEHDNFDMHAVEKRFDSNIEIVKDLYGESVTVIKRKGYSEKILSKYIADGYSNYFDFIYIDASHQAKDVIFDAVAAFRLARVGGVLGFDDYGFYERLPGGKVYCDALSQQLMRLPIYTGII